MLKNISYFLIILGTIYLLWKNTPFKETFYQWQFDRNSQQTPVLSKQDIDQILNSFESIPFKNLQEGYISKIKYDVAKYKKLVNGSNFLKINGIDIYKYVVGEFRIKDFLPKDDFYYQNINALGNGIDLFWLIDKNLLHKLLELQKALIEKGYNGNGFDIVDGYRHPDYNQRVGGADLSHHQRGQALDLLIRDINNDGYANQEDKEIVLGFLENKTIGNHGGIGRYPGTMSVHFDVRGYKARWDQQ